MEKVRFTLRLPEGLHKKVQERSESLGISINSTIIVMLSDYERMAEENKRFMTEEKT